MKKKLLRSFRTPHIKKITLADGQTMPVLVVGKGQPVVLVHGFGMDAKAWLPFVTPLAKKYKFYLPYMRGFGLAAKNSFSQDDFLAEYVQDIVAMRQQLNLNSIKLGGISMGSLTNLALLDAGYFDGVTGLLHIDQSPVMHNCDDWQGGVMGERQAHFFEKLTQLVNITEPHMNKSYAQLPLAAQKAIIDAVAMMIGSSFNSQVMRQLASQMPKYPALAGKLRDTTGWQNQVHIVKAYLNQPYDFRQAASQISIPTTVVTGKESRLYSPQWQTQFAQLIPHARHIRLKKAGHALLLDRPFASYKIMKTFLGLKD